MLSLEDCRRFYAEEIQFSTNLTSTPLVEAFATVPREKFLGPGPWSVASPNMLSGTTQYRLTPDADPRRVYHNVLMALDPSRDLNNGHPGSLATFINALALAPGDRVYHLGCGVGYYTAIIGEIVGAGGTVVASEVHPDLGPLAQKYLDDRPNVIVHLGDGAEFDPGESDAILVNAGVTHPLPRWLDRLSVGGRLVLPITVSVRPNLGHGFMVKITREADGYTAKAFSPVGIYSCTSARDPQLEPLLAQAMAKGMLMKVRSLRRDPHESGADCAIHGSEVCFNLAELPGEAQTAGT